MFPYLNKTHLDLSKYQIFRKNQERNDIYCLICVLENACISKDFIHRVLLQIGYGAIEIPLSKMKLVAEIIKRKIIIHYYSEAYDKNDKLKPYGEGEELHIAQFKNHFFIFEKTIYTKQYIERMVEIEEKYPSHPKKTLLNRFDKKDPYSQKPVSTITSLQLVTLLYKLDHFTEFPINTEYKLEPFDTSKYKLKPFDTTEHKPEPFTGFPIKNSEHKYLNDDIIDDSSIITIKERYELGYIKSVIQTIIKMNQTPQKNCLERWLFDIHYHKKLSGNLTSRVKKFNNQICYREIMKRCFNNIDVLSNKTIQSILNKDTIEFINELHSISPVMTGTFLDYLIRRIITELRGESFIDHRADYLLDSESHCCNNSSNCKMIVIECILPFCQKECYEKTKNVNRYKTQDIITDIFITSLSHAECFGGFPQQDRFNQLYEKIKIMSIHSLIDMCTSIIKDKTKIILNPILGGNLDEINISIPSDADLVVDDILIDFKCTKQEHSIYEILQLLGYSCLLMLHKKYNTKINIISVFNLYNGTVTSYDTKFISKENCVTYLSLLN